MTTKKAKHKPHRQHHRPRHPTEMKIDKTQHPPRLEPRFLVVKARPGGVVYYPGLTGYEGPLSSETWSAVPISPDIMIAINNGSVEQQVAE